MRCCPSSSFSRFPRVHGTGIRPVSASVLIIVLWVTAGLIGLTIYFAGSMSLELKASGNRAAHVAAEQAIQGAARYVGYVLSNYVTNGVLVTNNLYLSEPLTIGESKVWILGRNTTAATVTEPVFGLTDEGAKLNLNRANSNALASLPGMSSDLAAAIVDWRSTNGTLSLGYTSLGYSAKHAPFESVDELRLVNGLTLDYLTGDDLNRNGILDTEERSLTGSREPTPGLLETTTVFSREPNFHSDGTSLTNVNTRAQIDSLLSSAFGTTRGRQILTQLGFTPRNNPTFTSLLRFYLSSGLSADDFIRISPNLSTTTNTYTYGRVNINTASREVLTALLVGAGMNAQSVDSAVSTLVSYRQQNPTSLTTVAWLVTALGRTHPVVTTLAGRDLITTRSFQYTADLAAVGPMGRGYARVKFIFDLSDGTPKIIHRQELTRLGWALGERVRTQTLAMNTP